MSDTRGRVEEALHAAIQDNGDMVTKWVACIEGFNSDGERYLWIMSDDNSMPWDRMGMMQFALTQEQADVTASTTED